MRNVCFTLNNYSLDEHRAILEYPCKYLVVGMETGENGTPHLQGYFEFKNPKRLETLKNFNPRIHWENRRGSAKQAADYCKKENNYVEKGEISKQGKRSDLEEIGSMILIDKANDKEVAMAFPSQYIRYSKGIEKLINLTYEDRTKAPIVTWLWGKAGVGKSGFAAERHLNSHYIKDGTKWWDNYKQEDAIIIDDFDGRWPFRDLLRLLDRYKYQGEYKGGYIKINSPYIYITCEFPPEYFWADNELAQILRRVTHVTEVGGNTRTPTFNKETCLIENYQIDTKYAKSCLEI